MENFENQLEDILRYDVISFDIFDTLIKRIVPKPTDVFSLVASGLSKKNKNMILADYKKNRINAERAARRITCNEEVTLDEIYKNLEPIYGKEVSNKLKAEEITCEKNVCIPNPILINFYLKCIQLGKKVFVISDMYLPESVINEILTNSGITKYKLYLSSSELKTKRTGTLFRYVQETEALDSYSWCHLGDNLDSDIKVPAKMGISTYQITEDKVSFDLRLSGTKNNIYNVLLARYAQLGSCVYNDIYELIGYRFYGPLLFQFVVWLQEQFVQNKLKHILFCARDGYYFQRAYQKLYPNNSSRSVYFYVSRKSLIYPLLDSILSKGEDIDRFFSIMWINILPRKFTIKELLYKLGFSYSKEDILPYTLDSIVYRDAVVHDKMFKDFFINIIDKNKEAISIEGKAFRAYLKNLSLDESDIAIVDLGWHGSTQAVIEEILNKDVWGYYLSFCNDTLHFTHARGYLADNIRANDPISLISTLLEVVFSAPHGSLVKYKLDDNQIQFICRSYEHISDIDEVKKIRSGMMQFIDDIQQNKFFRDNQKNLSNEVELLLMGLNPPRNFLSAVKGIHFMDNKLKPLLNNASFFHYLVHPKNFLKDLKESPWKVGFLSYTLGTSSGVASIYIFLKRIKRAIRRVK